MGLLSFLFGKAPQITFTPEGRTAHELEPEKWQAWKDRFQKNPNLNFRNHAGTQGANRNTSKAIASDATSKTPTKK